MAKGSRKPKAAIPPEPAQNVRLTLVHRTPKPNNLMPLVNAALFCERVVAEKDNVLTAVRIVDFLTISPPLEETQLAQLKAINPTIPIQPGITLQLLLVLKSDGAVGERTLRMDTVYPSGKKEKGKENVVNFLGDEGGGVNAQGPYLIKCSEEGLYWYDLKVNGKLLTRIPLRIAFAKPDPPSSEKDSQAPKKKD
jgi:hypothetical protein